MPCVALSNGCSASANAGEVGRSCFAVNSRTQNEADEHQVKRGIKSFSVTAVAATALAWFGWQTMRAQGPTPTPPSIVTTNTTSLHPVTIRPASPAPRVNTGHTNYLGQAATVSCATCHTTTKPNLDTHSSAELDEFHQGLKFNHGNLACLSCHNARNYDTLQLATGKPVEFANVMTLCAQCHGTAMRDYERGSHGGMNGYWDLTKGPRTRNNCVNCHDPHSPKYPQAMPVFAPRDRLAIPPKRSH